MMHYSRVVIEKIPPQCQRAAAPDLSTDERVESQTPVSAWLDTMEAHGLLAWLRSHYPLLLDAEGNILVYGIQSCEWEAGKPPPPPAGFNAQVVASASELFTRQMVGRFGPAFSADDWEIIRRGLLALKDDKGAKRLLRSVRGQIANLRKSDAAADAIRAIRESK